QIGLGEAAQRRRPPQSPGSGTKLLPGCPTSSEIAVRPAISLPQITFDFGSAQLRPEAIETLRNLGKALAEELKDQKLFTIEGHTDAAGAFEQNQDLSRGRAEAVRELLVRDMGVARERLGITGKA